MRDKELESENEDLRNDLHKCKQRVQELEKELGLRKTVDPKLEPELADEMEALPGIKLVVDGEEYYTAGDIGRVSKNIYITPADGIKRFEVTWYRTGLVSTMKLDAWLKNFKYVGRALPLPLFGDEVLALAAAELTVGDKQYYKPGDKGIVSASEYTDPHDDIKRIEITWYRTGLTSTMKTSVWFKYFEVLDASQGRKTNDELRMENISLQQKLASAGGGCGHRQGKHLLPELGDEMQALPTAELVANGKTYYSGGDMGQVCRETYKDEVDGVDRFEVTWYKTGLTSTMRLDAWLKNFRFLRSGLKLPTLGYEVLCMPSATLDVDGKNYYCPGDKGRVTKDRYTSSDDGIDRFEITWYRTGLTSTMKCNVWHKYFQTTSDDALAERRCRDVDEPKGESPVERGSEHGGNEEGGEEANESATREAGENGHENGRDEIVELKWTWGDMTGFFSLGRYDILGLSWSTPLLPTPLAQDITKQIDSRPHYADRPILVQTATGHIQRTFVNSSAAIEWAKADGILAS